MEDINKPSDNPYIINEATIRNAMRDRPTSLEEFIASRGALQPLATTPPKWTEPIKPTETRGKTAITNADIAKLESERNSIVINTAAKLAPAVKATEAVVENTRTLEQLLQERRSIESKTKFEAAMPLPTNPRSLPTNQNAPSLTRVSVPSNPLIPQTPGITPVFTIDRTKKK